MKKLVFLGAASLTAAFTAQAQEVGRVVSSTPVIQQVAVPRQVCTQQPVVVQHQPSGAGAAMGAIAGGALGSQIGSGSGRGVATVLGVLGGAVLGNRVEGGGATEYQTAQHCTTEMTYENRAVSYNVVYEFAGKQYQVNLPHDPGPTVQLQITPVTTTPPPATSAPTITTPAPLVVAPAPTVIAAAPQVIYPAYQYPYRPYYRPYYPPVSLHLGFVHHSGHRHGHRHRH